MVIELQFHKGILKFMQSSAKLTSRHFGHIIGTVFPQSLHPLGAQQVTSLKTLDNRRTIGGCNISFYSFLVVFCIVLSNSWQHFRGPQQVQYFLLPQGGPVWAYVSGLTTEPLDLQLSKLYGHHGKKTFTQKDCSFIRDVGDVSTLGCFHVVDFWLFYPKIMPTMYPRHRQVS